MEALAQLERERGNPADGTAKGGVETVDGKKGKQGRVASNEILDTEYFFKNEFFEERKDLLSKNHVYRNHINKFVNYLSLPDVQLSNAPARININIVEECIRYYHNKGELNSRSTMESQLESVKSFYDYLSETGKATDIFSDYNYSKFKDDIVDKYSLLEPVERGSYKCEDIKTILMELDKAIDNFQNKSAGIREEDINKCINKSIAQNDYYCYV